MTDGRDSQAGPGAATLFQAGVICLCVGASVMLVVHRPPLAAMIGGALLSTARRAELLHSLLLWTVVAGGLLAAALVVTRRNRRPAPTLDDLVGMLWPLTLAPVALYAFNLGAWSASPVLLYALTTAACAFCVIRTEIPDRLGFRWSLPAWNRIGPWAVLGAAIIAYVVYVSIHTIHNHWSLGTAAFDLGIQENTLWNTVHGDVLYSSLMGGHYLGVHTSLILLLVAPIYALAPATETLLVLQSLVLGLAALPLFLFARAVLGSGWQGVLVGLLWLSHPAVGGANFYDFHPIAFAPLFLFTAAHFWWRRGWLPFWVSIALLLTVKEELAIVVFLLGLVIAMSGDRRHGLQVSAVGAATFVVLQYLVIPHFAGGAHSYAWYYSDVIPAGEGPQGLVTTVLINPVFAVKLILTSPRILFVFQLFAPLALLPFLSARGAVLISYGLAATLLASRPPLHQIGFQYALTLLALGFVGALLTLTRFSDRGRRRALALAVMLALVTCYHYGMIWPRHDFRGGFHTIDFDYSDADRERYAELQRLADTIPQDASVLASENLVPHLARRRTVATERFANQGPPVRYDVIVVNDDGSAQRVRSNPRLGIGAGWRVEHTGHFVVFTREGGG